MFGWFKNRIRKENLKLVKQNQLAALHIKSFSETAFEHGQAESEELFGLMFGVVTRTTDLLNLLEFNEALSQAEFDEQITVNKDLRRLYDEILAGRQAFSAQFDNARAPQLGFDQKFVPNKGWDDFFNQYPRR